MTPSSVISLKNIRWEVNGKAILDIPSFEMKKSEIMALIGSNGAGKSSLLKIISLLEKPTAGEMEFGGEKVAGKLLEFRRRMAMVFQEPLLLNGSVYKNVAQGLLFRGMARSEIEQRVYYWLERLRISHLANRSQRNLSGGEAQRVSIARALAIEPEVLFLDEPFAAIDQFTRISLVEDMGEILKSKGISAVFITHNPEELSIFTDRICVMDNGRIIQNGNPEEVFNRPSNREVAKLTGVENILEGRVGKEGNVFVNDLFLKAEGLTLPAGTVVNVFIRPEHILPGSSPEENCFTGRIVKTIPLTSQYKLIVDCGFQLSILVSKGMFDMEQVKPGKEFRLHIPPQRVHVVPM